MPEQRLKLTYILAASHSGSTLTAMLLGAHPEICTVGELKAMSPGSPEDYRCSCRTPIGRCGFWRGITRDMAERGFSFDVTDARTDIRAHASPYVRRLLAPLHRGPWAERVRDTALTLAPGWRRHLVNVQARNAALVASLLARTGANVIADSSKIGIRLKYLLRNRAFDVRVVRVIRDGRAVALTYCDPGGYADAADPSLRGGGAGRGARPVASSIREGAWRWRRSNEEADALLRGLEPQRWTTVHYETLCADPLRELNRLYGFLGAAELDDVPDFRAAEHHVIGNGMRLDPHAEIRCDERWREVLSASDIEAFDSVAGALNRRYGYGDRPSPAERSLMSTRA